MPAGKRSIRYAVVGLGHIAQIAVLPAFAHARRNSQLVAVVSGDPDQATRNRETLRARADLQLRRVRRVSAKS